MLRRLAVRFGLVGYFTAGLAVALASGMSLVGFQTVLDGLQRWQTLIAGLMALLVGWATIRRIDKQIAAARDDGERARRATIAGQNQGLIDRLNRMGAVVAEVREAIDASDAAIADNSLGGPISNVEDYTRRGFDVDSVSAFTAARSRMLAKVKAYERARRTTGDATPLRAEAYDASAKMSRVLDNMVRLLGRGVTLQELANHAEPQLEQWARNSRDGRR